MKLNMVLKEWYTSTSWRKLEIDTDDYPELKGMSKADAQQHIIDKYDEGDLNEIAGGVGPWSLEEDIRDADIVREKITGEGEDIDFE
tara:strand:- start:10 stop:270 length:261 start_codon:yes stop_codon:yes gene_type:complete